MNPAMILRTVFEFAMLAAVLWGIFHEDRLVAFEKRIACLIRRRRLRVVKSKGFPCKSRLLNQPGCVLREKLFGKPDLMHLEFLAVQVI